MRKKMYLASPLGFSEPGRYFLYHRLIPVIERCGFTVLDPWKLTPEETIHEARSLPPGRERAVRWKNVNAVIAENNTAAIDECDAMTAVLDGPDVDSGTASEIGYAAARGKTIIGYRSDFRPAGDNEGSVVNLQVEHFILRSGGRIAADIDELEKLLRETIT